MFCVQALSHNEDPPVQEEPTHRCDISILLILLTCSRDGKHEASYPWNPNLQPHFQVHRAHTRIQASTHEIIVEEIPRHSDLLVAGDCDDVGSKTDTKPVDHSDGHEMPIIVDDFGETESTSGMKDDGGDHGYVEASNGVAVIHEGFVA